MGRFPPPFLGGVEASERRRFLLHHDLRSFCPHFWFWALGREIVDRAECDGGVVQNLAALRAGGKEEETGGGEGGKGKGRKQTRGWEGSRGEVSWPLFMRERRRAVQAVLFLDTVYIVYIYIYIYSQPSFLTVLCTLPPISLGVLLPPHLHHPLLRIPSLRQERRLVLSLCGRWGWGEPDRASVEAPQALPDTESTLSPSLPPFPLSASTGIPLPLPGPRLYVPGQGPVSPFLR